MDGFCCDRFAGRVDVVKLPKLELSAHPAAKLIKRRFALQWRPSPSLSDRLPNNYCVALECWLCSDGVRRLSPADPNVGKFKGRGLPFYDATAFALGASVGGRALIWARNEVDPVPILNDEAARIVFQFARHLREYLGPTRKLGKALAVSAGGRRVGSDKDILPCELGIGRGNDGVRWTIGRFNEEGLRTAVQRGNEHPTDDEIFRLGLLAAAESDPLQISDDESESITRLALFNPGPNVEKISEDVISFVAVCVSKSIRKSLTSNEKLAAWIEDPKSGLIRSIQKLSGDKLSRDEIRNAVLELAWRSLKMFARTVDYQMREFRAAMPDPLTVEENFLYEQMYLANPMFGGLPLILLHDRLEFLLEVVTDFWNDPSQSSAVAKVRTMLYYYAVAVGNRREADRLYKRRTQTKGRLTGATCEVSMPDDFDRSAASPAELGLLHEAARLIAVSRHLISASRVDDCAVKIIDCDEKNVSIDVCDADGRFKARMVVTRYEFDRLVIELGTDV